MGVKIKIHDVVVLLLVSAHVVTSIFFSSLLPWGDDEWYTWEGMTIMAFPYTITVQFLKLLLGAVTYDNYILYRQIGLLFVVIAIAYVYTGRWRAADKYMRRYSLIATTYLVLSSFIIYQEQYFRYYGFYVLASFLSFHLLYPYLTGELKSRKRLIFMIVISPIMHMFLFWQLVFFFVTRELLTATTRNLLLVLGALVPAGLLVIAFWKQLMAAIMPLMFFGTNASSLEFRGWSAGLLFKPFYALFQFFFGTELTPTEHVIVALLAAFLPVYIGWKLWQLKRENSKMLWIMFGGAILPFIAMYWILEPLTLPGVTQFESKHALFVLPYILFVISYERQESRKCDFLYLMILLLTLVAGTVYDFNIRRPKWDVIVNKANKCVDMGGVVVLDGRSRKTFDFYSYASRLRISPKPLESMHLITNELDFDFNRVFLVVRDWKSYQRLDVRQNWNSGISSDSKVDDLMSFLRWLEDNGAQCIWSYGVYPTFAYEYIIPNGGSRQSADVVYPPQLMYKDIPVPFRGERRVLYGFRTYSKGDTVRLSNSEGSSDLLFCIEGAGRLNQGEPIAEMHTDSATMQIRIGERNGNMFQDEYTRGVIGAEIWTNWVKRPVITNSLRYPGSLWPSDGTVYLYSRIQPGWYLVMTRDGVRLHRFVWKMR